MATYQTLNIASCISFNNWIINSKIISVTNEDKNHPAKNLLIPNMSKTYRTTKLFNERNGYFQVVFDLGSEMLPTVVAIINSNITKTTGNGLYLIGADNASLTSVPEYFNALPLYETKTRVLRWYLGQRSDSIFDLTSKRYWGFRFYPNDWGNGFTDDPYFEFGNFWLGEYTALSHNYSSKIAHYDKSDRSEAFGGATYVDSIASGNLFGASLPYVSKLNRQNLVTNFNTYRKNTHVLVDFEPFIDDVTSTTGGLNAYYAKINSNLKNSIQFFGLTDIDISIMESIA